MSNLVNSVMEELEMNNAPNDLNYQPSIQQQGGGQMMGQQQMMGGPQMQDQQYMGGAEVNYVPQQQMQAPTSHPQSGSMGQPMSASPETMDMEAPDLSVYGMEEDEQGFTNMIFNEVKAPLIVAVLAFVMTLPQVNGMIRNLLTRATTNETLIGLGAALLMAVLFYVAMKFLA